MMLARRAALAVLVAMLVAPPLLLLTARAQGPAPIVVAKISGVIDGSTVDYVKQVISYAEEQGSPLIVLELNTPGGSLESALNIVVMLRHAHVPVVGYVVEHWAMSAGTLILECSHVAAMQPGTLIGAVQPVALSPSGNYVPINESKILNPVYKEIEMCMKMHGRNYTLARKFVYNNLVLTAKEALRLHAVDYVAPTLTELIHMVNNTEVTGAWGRERIIIPPGTPVEKYGMPPGLYLAHVLSDPLVSSILSSIGLLIILLGLAAGHPHLAALGVGLILLGLFGLGVSASIVAAALILIGLILLLVELFLIPGFGVVGFTGIALMLIGVLVAFTGRPVYVVGESMKAALEIMIAVLVPVAVLIAVAVVKVARLWRRRPVYMPMPIGKQGKALDPMEPGEEGFVMVEGEYWKARNVSEKPIGRGEKIKVVGKDGAVLLVEPAG